MTRAARSALTHRLSLSLPLALSVCGICSCRADLSLGTFPFDAAPDAPPPPAACASPPPSRASLADFDPALGDVAAIASDGRDVYAVAARPDGGPSTLLVVHAEGATESLASDVGGAPVALAVSASFAYVAGGGTATVTRIAKAGPGARSVLSSEHGVGAIAVDPAAERAYWTLGTADGTVRSSSFDTVPPTTRATGVPFARALAFDGEGRLWVAGDHALGVVDGGDARVVAPRCDGAALAVTRDGDVYCSEGDRILHVARSGGGGYAAAALAAMNGPPVALALGGGRLFVRTAPTTAGARETWTVPLDGVGGPTLLAALPGARLLATDACSLVDASARSIERRGLGADVAR